MRKFALLPVFAFLMFAQVAQAQVRDLFAEFEEEAAAEQTAEKPVEVAKPAAEPAKPEVVSPAAESSPVVEQKKSSAEQPVAPVPASSASVAPASSASVQPAVPASSAAVAETAAVPAPVDSAAVVPASSAAETPVNSAVVDSAAVPVPADSAMAASADSAAVQAPADSAVADTSVAASSSSMESSSSEMSSSSEVSSSSAEAPVIAGLFSSAMSRRDLLGPVKVSKVYGMDEVKGRYKSPRKALFMSLVIPGSGQLYTGGSTFTYARGAVYLALEAALWGGWYYYSVYKYDKQVSKYKKFAKSHYSIGRYETEMRGLFRGLADETEETRFEQRYMNSREDFCKALYGNAKSYGCFTSGKLFEGDNNHRNKFSGNKPLGQEISSLGSVYDKDALYQEIAGKSYILGWDDVEGPAVAISLGLESDSSEVVPLAKSSRNMNRYRDMRDKATDYADMQAWFFGGLILNHLISAVDAAFTANAHNKELYSEELSWYDRLHFDSYVSIFDGLDVGVQASWGF